MTNGFYVLENVIVNNIKDFEKIHWRKFWEKGDLKSVVKINEKYLKEFIFC